MCDDDFSVWMSKSLNASHAFALACVELRRNNPGGEDALVYVVNDLVTELWDMGFSQSEIETAFRDALPKLRRYAAGEDRRGDHGGP